MKIQKTLFKAIILESSTTVNQFIHFDTEAERDIVFKHWEAAIEELEKSKAIYRPVYEDNDGDTQILKLRYTTPKEVIEVEKARKENFPHTPMKLIMIYNEQERTFQNVNF